MEPPVLTGIATAILDDIPLQVIVLFFFLLFVAALSSLALYRVRFPFTIGLVLVGLACSWLGDWWALPYLPRVHLTENVILYVFLPALVFDAALSMDVRRLRENLVPILILAVPGVVFATVATGLLIHWFTPLGIGSAMLFGALISTTDPVAVIATFKELRAPKRLTMLVDGESLMNDATAIVLFGIISGLVAKGTPPGFGTMAAAAMQFLLVFGGGFLVGCVAGAAFSWFISRCRNAPPELSVLFSICAAYGSFLLAQGLFDLSGVMATVGTGMVIAHGLKKSDEGTIARSICDFWPVASFFGNTLIFLFLGLTERYLLSASLLAHSGLYMALACIVVLAVRAAMVGISVPLSNALPGQERIDLPYRTIMIWGGLRGALPIGLAVSIRPEHLGLSNPLGAADEARHIVLYTVAVVLFTLLVQGTTISAVMRKTGLIGKPDEPLHET